MPTLAPGCHCVPRWRTRILPARTYSPPYLFTPRRRPAVSRPLREEPPAFLCAIAKNSSPCCSRALESGADDFLDAHRGLILTVTALAARIFAPALLECDDLGGATLLDDLRHHLCPQNGRRANLGIARATQH